MSDVPSTPRTAQRAAGEGGSGDRAAWSRASTFADLVGQHAPAYRTVGEMVYDVLKTAILNATFAPGERLRQEVLAEAIGVSRIPVRSALLQLESEGLVVFHPRRGAVVRSLTPEQIREIYQLRELLEVHALQKSAATITPERVTRLKELAKLLDTQDEGSGFVELRVEFYRELYDAENNPRLIELIEELRSSVGRYLLGWRVSHGHGADHGDIVDALARGDGDGAVQILRSHLDRVRDGVERMLSDPVGQPAAPKRARRTAAGGAAKKPAGAVPKKAKAKVP